MSYLTTYYLDVDGENGDDIHREITKDHDLSETPNQSWYNHEEDMLQYSLKYPNNLLRLEGWGEYPEDDIWVKYFKNGKMQHSKAKIIFEECRL